ncbi:MAG: peroxiredoxin family protein [Acidobacteriota bacterium]
MENETSRLNLGDRAPAFQLAQSDGKTFSLTDALTAGSSLLLIFCHGSSCTICQQQLSELQTYQQRFEDRGIRPIIITTDRVAENRHWQKAMGLSFPVLSDDSTVTEEYGVLEDAGIKPTLIIVDRHGTIGWIYVGNCTPNRDWPTPEYIFRHMVIARGV